MKQKTALLIRRMLFETGEDVSPSSVPLSFSWTNNLIMIKISVKKIINHIWITNISIGILTPKLIVLYDEEKINIEIIPNKIIEIMSLACLISDLISFCRIVMKSFKPDLAGFFFVFHLIRTLKVGFNFTSVYLVFWSKFTYFTIF